MAQSSIKTTICEYSVCRELYECFYRSSRYNDMVFHDGIAPLLKTCRASELYLGTYASTALWRSTLSEAVLQKEITEQRCCIAELFKLDDFAGFYFPLCRPGMVSYPDDWAHRTKVLYRAFAEKVRELSPKRKVLLPISAANVPGTLEDFVNEWKCVLDEAKPDALLVTGSRAEIWRQLEYPIIYA